MPGPGPDQPGQALPGGTPHAVRGVPGHRTGANPAQSSSERLTWPTSVVCDSAVDGNIEIPSGGTPQDVHVFNMAGTFEKSNTSGVFPKELPHWICGQWGRISPLRCDGRREGG